MSLVVGEIVRCAVLGALAIGLAELLFWLAHRKDPR